MTDIDQFNTELAAALKGLKKDLGAVSIRQGYRGTGSKQHRRQVFIRFANQESIDLWLKEDRIELGGVIRTGWGQVGYNGRSVDLVYKDLVTALAGLAGRGQK